MDGISSRFNNIHFSSLNDKSLNNDMDESSPEEKRSTSKTTLSGLAALAVLGAATVSMSKGKGGNLVEGISTIGEKVKPENLPKEPKKSGFFRSLFSKPIDGVKGLFNEFNKYYEDDIVVARNRIKKLMKDSPSLRGQEFREVDKTVTMANGEKVRIIYEGKTIDVTIDGKLMLKIRVPESKGNGGNGKDDGSALELEILLKKINGEIIRARKHKKLLH